MNRRVLFYSIVVALGGFLFGFDTAVISGAEQAIQVFWTLSEVEHGFTVSIALIGTVFGALFGGIPSDKFGRKPTLLAIGILYFVSALGSGLAEDWILFLCYRFIGGLGVGASSVVAPMYISEIAPARSRGGLVALFQFNIVFGILIAFLSNYAIAQLEIANDWRWMLGIESLPALFFAVAMIAVPESPRWLIVKKGHLQKALAIFNNNGEANSQAKVEEIKLSVWKKKEKTGLFQNIFHFRKPLTLAFLFAFFNQLSGINAIIYYAPRIFEMTGLEKSASLLSSVGVGAVNFFFTLLAMVVIDRFGRKKLMHVGSAGLIMSLSLISLAFYSRDFEAHNVPVYLFLYIGFFAFSQGAVIWVFISEIFPNEIRALGQSVGSFTHWFLAALVAFIFPGFTAWLGPANTFMVFLLMMVLQWLFVFFVMPETRGKSLEDIGKEM